LLILSLLLLYSVFSALGMVLIKKGGERSGVSNLNKRITISLDYKFFIGILLYITSFILWIIILQAFPIVYISPIGYGLNFIFTALFAFIFLSEKVRQTEIIGVITIIVGVILVSVKF